MCLLCDLFGAPTRKARAGSGAPRSRICPGTRVPGTRVPVSGPGYPGTRCPGITAGNKYGPVRFRFRRFRVPATGYPVPSYPGRNPKHSKHNAQSIDNLPVTAVAQCWNGLAQKDGRAYGTAKCCFGREKTAESKQKASEKACQSWVVEDEQHTQQTQHTSPRRHSKINFWPQRRHRHRRNRRGSRCHLRKETTTGNSSREEVQQRLHPSISDGVW